MKRDEIDALIKRLTADAQANPDRFLHRIARFAFLGYTYIGLVLVLMAAFLAGLVAMVLALPNGFTAKIALVFSIAAVSMTWSILMALWVRTTPPDGIRLHPQDAPALFERIARLAREVGSPNFDEVLIVPDYNVRAS